jgi:hypothetical protein
MRESPAADDLERADDFMEKSLDRWAERPSQRIVEDISLRRLGCLGWSGCHAGR